VGLQSPASTRDVHEDVRFERGTEHRRRRGDLRSSRPAAQHTDQLEP